MRTWLFYKKVNGSSVEFRRVDHGGISNFLPDCLRGTIEVPANADVDKYVQSLVRKSGWVGGEARIADCEVGKVVLKGQW